MDNKTIKQYCEEAHKNAVEKGFYEGEVNIGEKLMLIVSELGEALEAHRKGKTVENLYIKYKGFKENYPAGDFLDQKLFDIKSNKNVGWVTFEQYFKDTFEDEIADTFIRLFDLCGYEGYKLHIFEDPPFLPETDNIAEMLLYITLLICQDIKIQAFNCLLVFCNRLNIDIEKFIRAKMAYNKTREHKHGKEY